MKKILRFCSIFALFGVFLSPTCFATTLSGKAVVNQTSDTASKAKTEAMNIARRQILLQVLSDYADVESLTSLMENVDDADLVPLISASSVSNEQMSVDSYSATITMNLDNDIVKQWLISNEIKNWVPGSETAAKYSLFIVVDNGLSDWAELKRLARETGTDIEIKTILGNQIFAQMPFSLRSNFTLAIRESDWKYSDKNGILQVWK